MVQLHPRATNLIFLTLGLAMGVFLIVGESLLAQTVPVANRQQTDQKGKSGAANDFHNDVELGLQNLRTNQTAQSLGQEIQNQDYTSTWDEFGTNALIDGTIAPAEIDREITQDIIQGVQVEQSYDRQEARYLGDSGVTPEEIQAVEEPGGSDIPPGEFIDPNPSAAANPDVSLSSFGESEQHIVPEEATSTETTSTSEMILAAPETSTSTSKTNTSSEEETIFDAILQGEEASQSPTESAPPLPEPSPLESYPVQ